MTQTSSDLQAVVAALRERDRFVVVTHENPDGDALGSLLATTIALRELGKDVVMYLAGTGPLPREYSFMQLDGLLRELPGDMEERTLVAVDCAKADRMGPDSTAIDRAQFVIDIDHHHDNTRFGDVNLIVADASSTGEVLRDVFRELGVELTPEIAEALYIALVTDTGRFQYTNTTPKSLRLAAELVDAGADVHAVFQQVYESVEFAKLKLLARALERARVLEGGLIVVSNLAAQIFRRSELRSRTRRGSSTTSALSKVPSSRRSSASHLATTRPHDESRCAHLSTSSTCRRSRARSAAAAIARRPASRARRQSTRSPSSSAGVARAPPRALEPAGIALVDKPAGPSSHAIVAQIRRLTGARTGHAGTLDPFATGLLLVLSGRATKIAPWLVGLDKRYLTEIDLTARTSTGDPEGEVVGRLAAPAEPELERRLARLRGEIRPPIPAASAVKIGGERAYRLARRCCPARRSTVRALDVISYTR
jgi:phosphoesterase RecJ-like protein